MSAAGLTFLVLIGGFVWGGFLLLLVKALRSEAGKTAAGESPDGG